MTGPGWRPRPLAGPRPIAEVPAAHLTTRRSLYRAGRPPDAMSAAVAVAAAVGVVVAAAAAVGRTILADRVWCRRVHPRYAAAAVAVEENCGWL